MNGEVDNVIKRGGEISFCDVKCEREKKGWSRV